MGRKQTTKRKNATEPKAATSTPGKTPPAPPVEAPVKDPELSHAEALEVLKECGDNLDQHPQTLTSWCGPIPRGIATVRELVMHTMLKIRDKRGHLLRLHLNRAQRDLEKTSGKRNIVLKARQLGVTTYVAARFFVSCITREGTLSVQVAHDQRSAEEIFRIVHRLLENLPESLRQGALVTSRANVRQIVFPMLDSEYRVETAADPNAGRGLTIHNLHCSEVARWPRDVSETLASLRAAVPPDGEIFLESTPNGAGGTFYDEWQRAPQTGYVRHFYPWWWDPNYRREVEIVEFSEQERELMHKHNLDPAQIAFRREMRANFGNRAPEEYAEDPESCFLASGDGGVDRQRQTAHVLPARRGRQRRHSQAIHHWRGSGRWRLRWRLCLCPGHRALHRSAVRRAARTFHAAGVGGSGRGSGPQIQPGTGGRGTQQSWTRRDRAPRHERRLSELISRWWPARMAHHCGFASSHVGELRRRAVECVVPLPQPAAVAGMSHLHPPSGRHFGRCWRRA